MVFKNTKQKVKVICKTHGQYEVNIHQHLKGQNCKKCMYEGGRNLTFKLDNYKFKEKSNLVHNFKYDYSNVNYVGNKFKVKILCPVHGLFEQRADRHMQGDGCIRCSGTYQYTLQDFVSKSQSIHGIVYDYTNVVYINNDTKVTILCPQHGDFEQIAKDHLKGSGCPICGKGSWTSEKFILEANKIHHNFYNYPSIISKNIIFPSVHTKIKIKCPIHSNFIQKASDHLRGSGCPKCNSSKGEKAICYYLDNNYITYKQQYKFDNCKYKKQLSFDFYIPSINLCIEYDGEQHFKPITFGGMKINESEEKFKKCQQRDKIKTQYCKDNNIELLRIPYTEFKNIEDILVKFLSKLNKSNKLNS